MATDPPLPEDDFAGWEGWVPGDPVPTSPPRPPAPPAAGPTPPPPPPPGAWVPTRPAPSTPAPAVRRGVVVVVASALALVGVAGAAVTGLAVRTTDRSTTPPGAAAPAPAPAPTTSGTAAPITVDLLGADPTPWLAGLWPGGPLPRLRQLGIYQEYVVVEVEPPDQPGELDRWVVWPGEDRRSGPDPVSNVGPDETAELFDPTGLDLSLVPEVGARARQILEIDDGVVTHVLVGRQIPFDPEVGMSVYVQGARDSGYVRFDPTGAVVSIDGLPVD